MNDSDKMFAQLRRAITEIELEAQVRYPAEPDLDVIHSHIAVAAARLEDIETYLKGQYGRK